MKNQNLKKNVLKLKILQIKKLKIFLVFLFLFIFSTSLGFDLYAKSKKSKHKKSSNPVLAVVNSKKITMTEFNRKYKEVKEKAFLVPSPQKFLEDLINYEIGVQEGRKRNLIQSPLIQERMNQEVYKVFVEKSIGKRVEQIKVSRQEMVEYYRKNPLLHIQHILVEFPPEPNAKHLNQAKTRATQICKKVKKNNYDFKKAARLYSDDSLTKFSGGDLGFRSRFTLSHIPEVYNTALGMKNGNVECLVKTKHGYHMVKRIQALSYSKTNKNQLKASVFDQKRAKIFVDFFERLQKKHKVKRNLALIKKIQ